MNYPKNFNPLNARPLKMAICLAGLLCLTGCATKSPTVLTNYVGVDQPSVPPEFRVNPKFKMKPPSTLLENQNLNSRAIRESGSHDNSAQIADSCLADLTSLDIAFDDLVNEIKEAEAADKSENSLALKRRAKSLLCIQKLNEGENCEPEEVEADIEAEK